MIRFVDLQRQYQSIKPLIDASVQEIIARGAFILGSVVDDFERAFALYCGVDHCVGVANGTDALALTLEAYGIGPGDEVIVPANTFIATAFAVSRVGAAPVLVDVDAKSNLVTRDTISGAITSRTRAVIPVHLFGSPVDMDPILAVAKQHSILVVEDACQAHGALYRGARVGSFGDAAAFSFYPGKNLGAYGDGGAVVTNDGDIAAKIRLLRDLGQRKKYNHVVRGHNSRLDALQASILRVKLAFLDDWNAARRRCAAWYSEELLNAGIAVPPPSSGDSVYHLYSVPLTRREQVMAALHDDGIEFGIHYPVPIHLQPAYADLGHQAGDFPVTEAWSKAALSLPIYPELTRDELHRVCNVIEYAEKRAFTSPSS